LRISALSGGRTAPGSMTNSGKSSRKIGVAASRGRWTVLTVKQAAKQIGISPSLVYELCRLGVLRHTRHGRPGCRGTIRISEEAVTEYLAACQRQGVVNDEPLRHIR
jgi:excisionase family DNA binding protein